MFTGIIEDKGKVLRVEFRGQAKRLTIGLPVHLTELQLGDSINVNGVCLTVVERSGQGVTLDLSEETIKKTALGELKGEDPVNLERALKLTDRLGGHIVTGHIDGVGVILEKKKERDFVNLKIRIPKNILKYVVSKGSIAIDGISLTVNELIGEDVQITLIPYTLEKTNLMEKKTGDRVNVEADILGKYVEKMLEGGKPKGMDFTFLEEHGFKKKE